jgi:hypothetical protein
MTKWLKQLFCKHYYVSPWNQPANKPFVICLKCSKKLNWPEDQKKIKSLPENKVYK